MALRQYGNQLPNPYAWQTFLTSGNGGGPGSVLRRMYDENFVIAAQYVAAEYGLIDPANVEIVPQLALPLIVGGKPRAAPFQRVAPPLPPPPMQIG